MKDIEAVDVLTFGAGAVLKLSQKQAAVRMNFLKSRGDGVYETTGEIQFKRGEKLGVDGPISKAMLESVMVDGKPGKPEAPAKPKNAGPVKFVMPQASDTPAAQQAKLDKLAKKAKG